MSSTAPISAFQVWRTLRRPDRAQLRIARLYAASIGLSGLAFAARWGIGNSLGERVPFTLFLIPVVVSAWYGGLGPGLLSTALCLLVADYSIQRPFALLMSRDTVDLVRLVAFVAVGVLASTLSQRLHTVAREARRQSALAEAASAELEAKAAILLAQRSELDQARREAEAANQAKGRFLASISHDLRTPLNAVIGYTDLIEMEARGPVTAAQRTDLQRIRRAAEHLLALIQDILLFAKSEAGAVQLSTEAVSLAPFLAELEALIAPQADARGIQYQCLVAGTDPVAVLADPVRLRQIALNLIANAIKFTGPGGSVRVTCEADPAWVCLQVSDSGCGIAPEIQESIFEPFVQAADGAAARDGVGLGLAISRDLARRMGGDIAVQSAPGAGSTFTVRLPRAPR